MEDITGREIIASCNFSFSVWLRVALGLHDTVALITELEARRRMDGIVNAAMTGTEASQQGAIICVYDSVYFEPSNISLPDGNPGVGRSDRQCVPIHNTLFLTFR